MHMGLHGFNPEHAQFILKFFIFGKPLHVNKNAIRITAGF